MIIDRKKLVSIIMPVYNSEKFIDSAIKSILKQTYKNFELIIINDGSTDKTINIIKSHLVDKRLRLYSLKRRRIVACLNFGLKRAKGDYVARMDADDVSHPTRIAKQVNFLNNNIKYDIIGSRAKYIDEVNFFSKLVPLLGDDCKASIIFKNPFIHSSIMIKKKIIISLGGYKKYFKSEDYHLWSSFFEKYKGKNLKENLIKYRVHSNQHGSNDKTKEKDIKKIQEKWIKKLGIKISKKNINFHYALSIFNEKFKFDKNVRNYNKYLLWLLTLRSQNGKKNVFNVSSFNKIIYLYFIGITLLFAGHGVKVYIIYRNSIFLKKKPAINFLMLMFCFFKIRNFYLKKFFWYIVQLWILK